MAYPWFSIIAWALIAVLIGIAVTASVVVWRAAPSLSVPLRAGLIACIAIVAAVAIMWIMFVAPVYVD